jgi:hypothetical protein
MPSNEQPSIPTQQGGLPSLLMQAARSAALADGLLPKKGSGQQKGDNKKDPILIGQSKPPSTSAATNEAILPQSKSNGNRSAAVEAALAMVAAGNSKAATPNHLSGTGDNNNIPSPSTANPYKPVTPSGLPNENNKSSMTQNKVNASATSTSSTAVTPQPNTLISSIISMNQGNHSIKHEPIKDDNNASTLKYAGTTTQPASAGSAAHMLAMAAAVQSTTTSTTKDNVVSSTNTPTTSTSASIATSIPKPTTLAPPTTSQQSSSITMANTSSSITNNNNPPVSTTTSTTQRTSSTTSSSSAPSGGGKKKGPPLRRGKWTPEEEAYANRLILEFKAGLLPLTDGTTLRTFLSKLLNCDPMRISKKFVGSNCIGKQVFRRRTADINRLTSEQIQQSRAELSE